MKGLKKTPVKPWQLFRLMTDRGTPWSHKAVMALALLYLLLPADLIPDMPFIGFLDDLGVLAAAVAWVASRQKALAEGEDQEDPSRTA
ncbi:MAG: DUF1232 domain-containing protein [Myxococcota bacterium]